jgi:hypothetical protein
MEVGYKIEPLARFRVSLMGVSCAADCLWWAPKHGTKAAERKKHLADFDNCRGQIQGRAAEIEPLLVLPDGTPPRQWLMALLMEMQDLRPELACRVIRKYDELAFDQHGNFIESELARSIRRRESVVRELKCFVPEFTPVSQTTDAEGASETRQRDKKDDKSEKLSRPKRELTENATRCIRNYNDAKANGRKTPMKQIVSAVVAETGDSKTGLMRILNDHPELWKTAKRRHKNRQSE